jgi:hypothetical protein
MDHHEYVDMRKLAQITGISASTWNKRRLTGDTPPFKRSANRFAITSPP